MQFVGRVPDSPVGQDPDGPFHRRDLTVVRALDDKGQTLLLRAYGGVFKGGRMEGYLNPVTIASAAASMPPITLTVETSEQLMNHYACAAIPVFDARTKVQYTTFFGGISQYWWDPASQTLKRDVVDITKLIDGLPFIQTISTLRSTPGGTAQYLHNGQTFPPPNGVPVCQGDSGATSMPYLGAESVFFANEKVLGADGVFHLETISAATVVGHLFGGIASDQPYPATTCASPLFYEVTLDPTQATQTVLLTKPD